MGTSEEAGELSSEAEGEEMMTGSQDPNLQQLKQRLQQQSLTYLLQIFLLYPEVHRECQMNLVWRIECLMSLKVSTKKRTVRT